MAMILSRFLPAVAGVALFMSSLAAFAQTAGRVEFALGDVRIRNAAGTERPAARGASLEVGETVVTGTQGQAQVRMVDNAFIAVRPDSEVNVNQYHFVGSADGQENAVLRLIKGTMRAFTGQIAQLNKDKFVTVTPTATIGVRGTGNIAHYSPNLGTLNHTIEGSHVVSSVNPQGQVIGTPIVTLPGQTVQVVLGQPPVRIPTPPFLLQAATSQPTTAGGESKPSSQAAQASQETSGGQERSKSTADTALTSGSPTTTQTTTTTVAATTTTTPVTTAITGSTGGSTTLNLTSSTISGGGSTSTLTGGTSGVATSLVVPPLSQLGTEAGLVFLGSFSSFTSGGTASPAQPFSPTSAQAQGSHFDAIGDKVSFGGPNGNLSSGTGTSGGPAASTVSVGGVTTGASSVTTLPNGISFGSYAGRNTSGVGPALQVTQSGVSGPTLVPFSSIFDVVGNLYWIAGPGVWPVLSPSVLTGTLTFGSFTGPPPTDQNGVAGTLNSASLSVNFDRQSVNAAVNATIGSNNWVATANNITMKNDGHFGAQIVSQGSQATHQTLNLTLNGTAVGNSTTSTSTSTFGGGRLEGSLTGPFMTGAGIGYAFEQATFGVSGQTLTAANGVVAFQNPSFSSPPPTSGAPFQFMFRSRGTIGGFDGATGAPIQPSASFSAANISPQDYLTRIAVSAMSPSHLTLDSQGAVTQFDGQLVVVDTATSGTTTSQTGTPTEVPARFSIVAAGTGANGTIPTMPAISGTAATVAQFGNDTTTGISWGRYSSGNFAIVDRVTGNIVNSGASIGNINHYILGPVQTVPTTLPTTGTVAYTFVGGTSPTDLVGTVGTLNSATLSANFSAQTVDAGVNATVGTRTYAASATGVPIMGGIAFEATKPLGGTGNLSVSCSPGCPTATAGRILGGFTGPTGEGAMMAYSLNAGGVPGGTGASTVGGVAAFKR